MAKIACVVKSALSSGGARDFKADIYVRDDGNASLIRKLGTLIVYKAEYDANGDSQPAFTSVTINDIMNNNIDFGVQTDLVQE